MTDFNKNITRKLDLNRKKMELKTDFDSSLTCYNLDPKSMFFLSISGKTRVALNGTVKRLLIIAVIEFIFSL
jgi:hypothetical protein